MDQQSQMKKALQARRGKGIDINVIMAPGAGADDKKTDLAPKPEAQPMIPQEGGQVPNSAPMSDSMGMKDGDLLEGMSDGDKKDMAGRSPRSLGERARQEMLMKMSQKK